MPLMQVRLTKVGFKKNNFKIRYFNVSVKPLKFFLNLKYLTINIHD